MESCFEFSLSSEQILRYDAWKKTLPPEPSTAIGGADTFMFIPTSLGVIIKVKYSIPGFESEIDLTDYDSW